MSDFKSPLHRMVCTTDTDFWNDSCSLHELAYAMEHGAAGATTNPSIVLEVLGKERQLWQDRIRKMIQERPAAGETELAWQLMEEMAVRGAELLLPVFRREGGLKGRLSIQTDPTLYRDAGAITRQAVRFAGLGPNLQVKIPVTRAGVAAVEEATAAGVNINATVCFTVPQTLAVAEAVEHGLRRREAGGGETAGMTPVCTLMVGRLDDWLRVICRRDGVVITPGHLDWAGIACIKKAAGIYQQRGYRTRLLAAAYRHHLHWSELVGGGIILTIPHAWQVLFNASDIQVRHSFAEPVDPAVVRRLYELLPDFRQAYDEGGLTVEEFDSYGATRRTLRTFIAALHDLVAVVRDFMIPDPDREA